MAGKVKIGIIGTGVGIRTMLPGFRLLEDTEVTAICGSSEERSQEIAKRYGIQKAFGCYRDLCDLPELDLVCIASPNVYHYEHAMYAIGKGKHVLCEKPVALTREEISSLLDKSGSTDRICVVNHQLRFSPHFNKVRDMIKNGDIGKPYFVRIHQQSSAFTDRNAPWNWGFDESKGGGFRLSMGTHLADLVSFWFGNSVYTVKGSMHPVIDERIDDQGRKRKVVVSAFFSAELAMENNISVQLSSTAASCGVYQFDVSIYGTHGELHFDSKNGLSGYFSEKKGVQKNIAVEGMQNYWQVENITFFGATFRYFAPCIVNAIKYSDKSFIKNASGFDDALHTYDILEAIRASSIQGTCVTLKEGYSANCQI